MRPERWKPGRTEFFEAAVSLGFYGREESTLTGKKDNVRKFWEDTFIKLLCRPYIEKIRSQKNAVRVLDLGAGSGEGFELLTHIPPANPVSHTHRDFVLAAREISQYTGLDVSPSMVEQGRKNYKDTPHVRFERCDLTDGLPSFVLEDEPYDLYFSSYSSLSHLSQKDLCRLLEQIFKHARKKSLVVLDLFGKFSPEWPKYWAEKKEMLPYTMAYLMPDTKSAPEKIEWYNVCFWGAAELESLMRRASENAGASITTAFLADRSILVGRHMDTGILNGNPLSLRYQVNRLFETNYRGELEMLKVDVSFLERFKPAHEKAWERIHAYSRQWNMVIDLLGALMRHEDKKVKTLIETTPQNGLADELKFLAWLFRNADRFPVTDFWAGIMGPQVACVLRNMEMEFSEGMGCGHGLVCGIEVQG